MTTTTPQVSPREVPVGREVVGGLLARPVRAAPSVERVWDQHVYAHDGSGAS